MASEEKSCQASAISSAGSPTMMTGLACSSATTRTARPTSCGRTSAANQLGTYSLLGRIGGLPRRHDGELAVGIHEHYADVAEMLELERQLLFELADLAAARRGPSG